MNVYQGLSIEEIEAQYFLRGLRPDYETTDVPGWLERSQRFLESADSRLDIVYGPRERNRLDLFSVSGGGAGFILYIHGGYWQRGDKSVYRFVAEPFVRRGFSVALMNYQMCPDVRMSEIAPQARLAVAWLWRNASELGVRRDNFNVMGHSAGGHLTAEMLFTDWSAEGEDLPRDLLHAGVAVSGIYDFEPILHCSENQGLRLDANEARIVSPIYREPATGAPQLVAYGMNEPPDMQRQSRDYATRFEKRSTRMECLPVPDADHFDTVNALADESSELFERATEFVSA